MRDPLLQVCNTPYIPQNVSVESARAVGFDGLVVHSSELGQRLHEVIKAGKAQGFSGENTVVVIGGGKSAQE